MAGIKVIRRLLGLLDVNADDITDGQVLAWDDANSEFIAADASAGGSGAPTNATYITQTHHASLSDEQALEDLATGIVKNTTTTGVLSIAAEGTDYYGPSGTDVAVADGGTGASNASGARTNLGLVIGTDVEAHDSDLTTIAGLSPTNDDVLQRKAGAWTNRTIAQLLTDLGLGSLYQAKDTTLDTYAGIDPSANVQSVLSAADYAAIRTLLGLVIGTNVQAYDADLTTYAGISPSANVQSLLGAADYAAIRTLLGLVIGTNVQAQDTELAAIAGLTSAADRLPYFTGSGTASLATFTSAGRALVDDADAAAQRTTLGVYSTTEVATELADQKRVVEILVSDPLGSAITTGDGKAVFRVPTLLNGHNLVSVGASVTTVSSSGIPTVQLRRQRLTNATTQSAADMLSTKLTIDASEFDSKDATAAAVIDTSNDDVQTGDQINIDVDVAGTGTKGLLVSMTFEAP